MNVSAPPTLIICCRRQHLHADRLLPPLRGPPPSLREAVAIHELTSSIHDGLPSIHADFICNSSAYRQFMRRNHNLYLTKIRFLCETTIASADSTLCTRQYSRRKILFNTKLKSMDFAFRQLTRAKTVLCVQRASVKQHQRKSHDLTTKEEWIWTTYPKSMHLPCTCSWVP